MALLALALLAGATRAQTAAPVKFPVSDWVYRLQPTVDGACAEAWAEIDATATDLAVIDPICGVDPTDITAAQLTPLCTRPDGQPRMVLAYLSVGEAEDYRFYWRDHYEPETGVDEALVPGNPAWLGPVNEQWPDNYLVKYWDPAWHDILVNGPVLDPGAAKVKSSLDRILAAGFDGVYLDLVDNYQHWIEERPAAKQEMIDLIRAIRTAARARFTKPHGPGTRHPGFVVIVQNGLELFYDPDVKAELRGLVSGIAVEGLYFDAHDQRQDVMVQAETEARLDALRSDGYLVLTVDYALEADNRLEAATRSSSQGYIPYVTHVELNGTPAQPVGPTSVADLVADVDPAQETVPEEIDEDEIEYGATPRPGDLETLPGNEDGDEDDQGIAVGEPNPGIPDDDDEDCDDGRAGLWKTISGAVVVGVLGVTAGPILGVAGVVAGGALGEAWRRATEDDPECDRVAERIEAAGEDEYDDQESKESPSAPVSDVDPAELAEAYRALQSAVSSEDDEARKAAWERLQSLQRGVAAKRSSSP